MSNQHEIRELFAWIVSDPTGTHGILAVHTALGVMPTINSQREVIEQLRPTVEQISDRLKLPIELRVFRLVGVLDTVEPR